MQQVVDPLQYYQHQDGGIYQCLYMSNSTVDQSHHVVYLHIYPFEQKVWHRPIEEWTTERFKMITPVQAWEIQNEMYPCDFRHKITEAKAERKRLAAQKIRDRNSEIFAGLVAPKYS
jgi:hypothetical protein